MLKRIPQDGWALEDDERNTKIDLLLKKLYHYDGTPEDIKSQGLLEAIVNHIDQGKSGLVNKK